MSGPEETDTGPSHPRESAPLIGHGEAARAFVAAHRAGRLAHAWLISGPRGIGKATLAFALARYLLSESGAGGLPGLSAPDADERRDPLAMDPGDPVFRRVAAGSHGDLLAIERPVDPKSGKQRRDITVDEIRRLGAFFSRTSAGGGWRVALIDAADEINRNAANALLKTLEEPPSRSVLLVVSHAPAGLLPTLRSRCRPLPLRPLSDNDIGLFLKDRRPELDEAEIAAIIRLAEGCPGRALSLGDGPGMTLYPALAALLERRNFGDRQALHHLAAKVAADEGGFALFIELLGQLIVRRATGAARGGEMPGAAIERLCDLRAEIGALGRRCRALNLDRGQVALTIFSALEEALGGA